jgi:hypothetical protein
MTTSFHSLQSSWINSCYNPAANIQTVTTSQSLSSLPGRQYHIYIQQLFCFGSFVESRGRSRKGWKGEEVRFLDGNIVYRGRKLTMVFFLCVVGIGVDWMFCCPIGLPVWVLIVLSLDKSDEHV